MREGTGTSLAVSGAVTAFFAALAALLVFLGYLIVSIYAVVKLIGDREGHPDPATVVLGFVFLTSVLAAGLLVAIRYLGGSLNSRKRPDAAD